MEKELKEYIKQMNEREKIAFEIAESHLGTSFDPLKSIGFKKYLKKMSQ